MLGSQPLRVPIGDDAERWRTFRSERTIVAAARTVTSTTRILETVPDLLRDDPRIALVFAYDPTSAFNDGVLDLLRDSGCRVMPWEQLAQDDPDLIVSASENVDVPKGACPVLVLPHGVGFQKYVPDSRSSDTRLSGVVPDALLDSGRVWLAVSHPDQESQLVAHRPQAAGRTVLVGDPCYDDLLLSSDRKQSYREALEIGRDHRLVVVSSTWGPTSLLGRYPDLPARLLAALPYDEYRVAAIIHPNVWSAHGAGEVRRLLATALDAGLVLLPPVHTWRAGLVAADLVVGDHGSVTLYGAALGKPVVLAAFGSDAVEGTAASVLGARAPRLDLAGDLRDQLDRAAEGHAADREARQLEQLAFSQPGHARSRLRASIYRLLELDEPTTAPAALRTLPSPNKLNSPNNLHRPSDLHSPHNPHIQADDVTSWTVTSTTWIASGHRHVSVRRYPFAAVPRTASGSEHYTHLASRVDERDLHARESASVVLHEKSSRSTRAAASWIDDALKQHSVSHVAATHVAERDVCWVGVRRGSTVEVGSPSGHALDAAWAAAVVYTCLRAGLPLGEGDDTATAVTLHLGEGRSLDLALRPAPMP